MPFREKAKNLFRRSSRADSLSKTDTNSSERLPSNVYKPGEMPKPKYRRAPEKEHKEKLEAFSFGTALRKKSFQSAYSPMGTRAHSRRTSLLSLGRRSRGSIGRKSEDARVGSVASTASDKSGPNGVRQKEGAAVAPRLQTEPEQEGDDDVTNGEYKMSSFK